MSAVEEDRYFSGQAVRALRLDGKKPTTTNHAIAMTVHM